MERIIAALSTQPVSASVQALTPATWLPFGHFDVANKLWMDYLSRFKTFTEANSFSGESTFCSYEPDHRNIQVGKRIELLSNPLQLTSVI